LIKNSQNSKATVDNIPSEALKYGGQTSVQILHKLLNTIWEKEVIPEDWKVKLPKKGDTSICKNWQGITLLAIASELLTTIILGRMNDAMP
jgi:hypothetical protein